MTSVTRLFICLGFKSYLPLTSTDNTLSPMKWRSVSRYRLHSTVHQHNITCLIGRWGDKITVSEGDQVSTRRLSHR